MNEQGCPFGCHVCGCKYPDMLAYMQHKCGEQKPVKGFVPVDPETKKKVW